MKKTRKILVLSIIVCLALSTTVLAAINGYEDDVKDHACARASETYCQASTFGIGDGVYCEVYYKFNHPTTENDRDESNGNGPHSVSGSPVSSYGYVQSSRASAWLEGDYEEAFAMWVP